MSETMSSPTDWVKFYQQNLSGTGASMDAAATTSSTTAINNLPISPSHGSSSSSAPLSPATALNPEGRVSKPGRRRSRASRRTPTTLLNTDTTNFRAMVQQFTGGPNAPFASAAAPPPPHGPGATTFSFSLGGPGSISGSRTHHQAHINNPNPTSAMASPGYRLQFHHHQQHQQYQQLLPSQYQNQNQGYMISLGNNVNNSNNNNNNNPGAGAGDHGLFFQRLGVGGGNLRPQGTEVSDGFLMDSSSTQVAVVPARPPSNPNENRGNGFMF